MLPAINVKSNINKTSNLKLIT
ncbi:MAG: hypothetical protein METHSR3v1_1270008 [Methanothrix sp.]|nr:MAG: hypothetical protein METHSR3v1_1270008 [Methanothrix sp.]